MIQLIAVQKSYAEGRHAPKAVFESTTVELPPERRIGVLARRSQGKSTLLQMLARNETPDQGYILAPREMSPVVNSGGLFHPQLSAIDNLRFLARAFGMKMEQLLTAADAFQPLELNLNQPIRMQSAASRRNMEAAVVTVLPFDCYLYDDIGQFEPTFFMRCLDAAVRRHAGVVFTTVNPKLLRQFADFFIVISDATLHPFSKVEEAIEFFEHGPESDKDPPKLAELGVSRSPV